MPLFVDCRSLITGNGDERDRSSLTRRVRQQIRSGVLTLLLGATFGVAVQSKVAARPDENTEKNGVMLRRVTLKADGETREVVTSAKTIDEMLAENRIILNEYDRCSLPLSARLKDGLAISIARVRVEKSTESQALPFVTKHDYSSGLSVGESVVKRVGQPGEKKVTYRDYYLEGKRTARVCVNTTVTPPVHQVEVHGLRGMTLASRHLLGGRRMISMRASAYGPSGNGPWGMRTCTGMRPGHGVVAVDPRFIRLGTKLYIEGYGIAVAGDTGSAIKGDRIDLGMDSDGEASQFGRRTVRVIILD